MRTIQEGFLFDSCEVRKRGIYIYEYERLGKKRS